MLRTILVPVLGATLAALLSTGEARAWGVAHVGVAGVGPFGGVYRAGRTVAVGPYGGAYYGGRALGSYGGAYGARYGVGYGGGYAGYHYYTPSYYNGYYGGGLNYVPYTYPY